MRPQAHATGQTYGGRAAAERLRARRFPKAKPGADFNGFFVNFPDMKHRTANLLRAPHQSTFHQPFLGVPTRSTNPFSLSHAMFFDMAFLLTPASMASSDWLMLGLSRM